MPRIEIYDTTLRDGTQGVGVSLTLTDKLAITRLLDALGVDFIEGGYPLSNPKDVAYFEQVRTLDLKHAKVCAFGMTRRKATPPEDDPGMRALVGSMAPVITIVGKTWDLHVDEVLRVGRDENLAMIRESVAYAAAADHVEQVFYDAEHFFDGYRANPQYALQTLQAALDGGATRLVLCDTNGGSMPTWITESIEQVAESLSNNSPHSKIKNALAIHPHNDSGLAVANALAAVHAGAVQVQGTVNGIGERCGNVDLLTVIANLKLKLGYDCLDGDSLEKLRDVSQEVYQYAQLEPAVGQPYVGDNAFAHKGGMHVHAVQRFAHSYEHVAPESVGNTRHILVSELAGRSNIVASLGEKFGRDIPADTQKQLLERVQDLEHQGYQFENAQASLELLYYDVIGKRPEFWSLDHYRCVILGLPDSPDSPRTTTNTEAIVKLTANGSVEHRVADGDGPVNALDAALRKCLRPAYPQIDRLHLTDYAVRVVNPTAESAAKVRATIEFEARGQDGQNRTFSTVGVNENIVDASWQALADALQYHLIECGVNTSA